MFQKQIKKCTKEILTFCAGNQTNNNNNTLPHAQKIMVSFFSRDTLLKALGWLLLILVLPNLLLWLTIWYFQREKPPLVGSSLGLQQIPQGSAVWTDVSGNYHDNRAGTQHTHAHVITRGLDTSANLSHDVNNNNKNNYNYNDNYSNSSNNNNNNNNKEPSGLDMGRYAYLAQIRYQANRERYEDLMNMSFVELRCRADVLGAMMLFIQTEGKVLLSREERHFLREQLRTQSTLLSTCLSIRRESQNAVFHRFQSRVAALKQQRQYDMNPEFVD
jgi:hypothetical protein